ncbi:class I SAM-dependent methyltransferase [Nonomuraea sp. NPDC050310]|uniref:class I SAM-dependent methyltransferase n=1 Tax=unclassified Nonomuraea TaxID=2593643 RepID=UPI0033F21123
MTKHAHHQHGHDHDSEALMAEMLDLDAEVLREPLAEVADWLAELAGEPAPARLLDLGAGTGTGTLTLLRRFPGAEVLAVDLSPRYLHGLRHKAGELGLAERVRTLQADLDAGWPAEARELDLVWAAGSVHHLADPDRVLREILAALRPGGLVALVEMDGFPRFLPHDLGFGRPGLEERLHAARAERHAEEMPHLGDDWGPRLTAAGFTEVTERVVSLEQRSPVPGLTRRYAQVTLQRFREGLGGQVAADDQKTLDVLLDEHSPGGLLRRDDLHLRAERHVWVGRR